MKARLGVVTLLLALAALMFASLPANAPAAVTLNDYEQQLAKYVNQERAKRGLAQLRVNTYLVSSAQGHAADMAKQQYFSHTSISGTSWSTRIIRYGYTRRGYSYWKAGENIFWGAGLYSSPRFVVDSWMRSSAHRAVILTRAFRDIGVGAAISENGYGKVKIPVWFFALDVGRRIQ